MLSVTILFCILSLTYSVRKELFCPDRMNEVNLIYGLKEGIKLKQNLWP